VYWRLSRATVKTVGRRANVKDNDPRDGSRKSPNPLPCAIHTTVIA